MVIASVTKFAITVPTIVIPIVTVALLIREYIEPLLFGPLDIKPPFRLIETIIAA